jgi:hypothetical protein
MWDADFAPIKRLNPGYTFGQEGGTDTSISTMAPLALHLLRGARHSQYPQASCLVLLPAISIHSLP